MLYQVFFKAFDTQDCKEKIVEHLEFKCQYKAQNEHMTQINNGRYFVRDRYVVAYDVEDYGDTNDRMVLEARKYLEAGNVSVVGNMVLIGQNYQISKLVLTKGFGL